MYEHIWPRKHGMWYTLQQAQMSKINTALLFFCFNNKSRLEAINLVVLHLDFVDEITTQHLSTRRGILDDAPTLLYYYPAH